MCCFFFFLCLRLWLELPVKCWIRVERMYSFAMLAGGEKHSALSIKKDVNINFLRLGEFLSIPILLCVCVCYSVFFLNHEGRLNFSTAFSTHVEMILVFVFGFDLLIWWNIMIFQLLNQPCILGINTFIIHYPFWISLGSMC